MQHTAQLSHYQLYDMQNIQNTTWQKQDYVI